MADVTVSVVENPVTVVSAEQNVEVSVNEQIVVISLGTSGPQGPSGTIDYAQLGYVHTQSVASSVWTINHGLGFTPNVTVVDSAGTVIEGSYNYPNANTIVLTFAGAFSGKAYFS
jgi:hypothetical protein